jgi:hypothetical protein
MPADADPRQALQQLAEDRAAGASEIAEGARGHLARLPRALPADEAAAGAREAALALVRGHPAMAPIVHLAHETLTILDGDGPAGLVALPREPPLARQVADQARPAIADAGTVLTYARSGTVLAAARLVLEATELRVITSEARPGDEGLAMADALAHAGADVTVTYDAHLPALVDEAALVAVGADAITAEVIVNKAGTRPLFARAQETDTPVHVLASRDKLWPAELPRGPRTDAEADWRPDVPDRVDVEAPLFEPTPLELADRIVTEDGPRSPLEVAASLEGAPIHAEVRQALAEASTS